MSGFGLGVTGDYSDDEHAELSDQLERFMAKIGMQDYVENLVNHNMYLPQLECDGGLHLEDLACVGVPLSAATTILQEISKSVQKEKMRVKATETDVVPPLPPADDVTQYTDGASAEPELASDFLSLSLENMRAALLSERNKNQELRERLAVEQQARRRAEKKLQQNQHGLFAAALDAKRVETTPSESGKEQSQADSGRHSRASSISEGVFNSSICDEHDHDHDHDSSSVADSAQAECRSEVSFSSHAANASDAASDLDSMHAYSYKDRKKSSLQRPPLPLTVGGTLPAVVGEEYGA
jgi:hypothetical protein